MDPGTVDATTGMARVLRTMQIASVRRRRVISRASSQSEAPLSAACEATANESMPATPSRLPPPGRFRMPQRCRTVRVSKLSRDASDEADEADGESEGEAVWEEDEGVDGDRVEEALEKMAKLELDGGEGPVVHTNAGDVRMLEKGMEPADGGVGDSSEGEEGEPTWTPYPHVFVIGDAADAFGAIQAGHNAYYQVSGRFLPLTACADHPRRPK